MYAETQMCNPNNQSSHGRVPQWNCGTLRLKKPLIHFTANTKTLGWKPSFRI